MFSRDCFLVYARTKDFQQKNAVEFRNPRSHYMNFNEAFQLFYNDMFENFPNELKSTEDVRVFQNNTSGTNLVTLESRVDDFSYVIFSIEDPDKYNYQFCSNHRKYHLYKILRFKHFIGFVVQELRFQSIKMPMRIEHNQLMRDNLYHSLVIILETLSAEQYKAIVHPFFANILQKQLTDPQYLCKTDPIENLELQRMIHLFINEVYEQTLMIKNTK